MLSGQLFTSSSQHVSITSAFDTEYLPTSTIETGQRYILQFRFMMAMMAIMAMMVIADANAIPLTIDIYWLMVLHRALRSPAVICASAGAEWHQATNLQGSKDQISQCTTTHNDSQRLTCTAPEPNPRPPRPPRLACGSPSSSNSLGTETSRPPSLGDTSRPRLEW